MITRKNIFSFIVMFIWICFLGSISEAQNISVKGIVSLVNETNGVAGVTVKVVGSQNGTVTDQGGAYHLENVPSNGQLEYSFVGYETQVINVSNRQIINIELESGLSELNEVVVIGYGTAKKKDLTGATASINTDKVQNEAPASVQDILRGNITGLNVGFSADSKGDASLQVRGRNTLNAGSSPLLVVDGVIFNGSMADINPNDVETIDVLKDASSAAVYGSKAANGVIQITTKRGKTGKPIINVNVSQGFATMSVNEKVYDAEGFLYDWRRNVMYSTHVNAQPFQYDDPRTISSDISIQDWLAYDNSNPNADPVTVWLTRLNLQPVEIENYKKNQSINWYNMMFHTGLRQDYNISLSGRTDKTNYYWSLGYMDNEGIIKGDDYSVVRSRVNLDLKITDFLSVGTNTQFSIRDESSVPVDWTLIVPNSPWGSFWNDDSTKLRFNPNDEASGGHNPFGVPFYTNRLQKYYELNSSLYGELSLPLGVKFKSTFTPRFEWYNYFNGESSEWRDWENIGGRATRENRNIYEWQIDNVFSWSKTITTEHHIDVTLLQNAEKFRVWRNKVTATGFEPSDILGYHNMGAGTGVQVCNVCDYSDEGSQLGDEVSTGDALMARLFYSYKDRYLLTTTIRRDGYSAFGQSHPRATFPSIALGWIFTEEDFVQNVKWLNYGKLRLSYGKNGNRDIGRYIALSDLNTGMYLHVKEDGTVEQVSQLFVNTMENKEMKWESTTSYNLGLDFSVLKDRVNGSIDLYYSKTTDLLVQHSLPDVTGFSFVWDNLGQVDNQGLEINLNSTNIQNQNFKWNTTFNFSFNRNKIVHLYGNKEDVKDENGQVIGQKEVDDKGNKWFIGHALDNIWDQKVVGVWQENEATEAAKYGVQPGDFHIEDVDHNYLYDDNDRQFLGYTEPRFRWTLRNDFQIFNDFTFSFFIYSYWGHMGTYNAAKNKTNSFPDRVSGYVLPSWTKDNPINDYARLFSSDGGASYDVYRKKSFMRMDNISLAYTVPVNLTERLHVQGLKVYFTVRNAFVYAPDWTFWDPENSGPTPRNFTFGVNLTL